MSELTTDESAMKLQAIDRVSLGDYIEDLAWSSDAKKLAAVTVEGAVYTIEVKSDSLTHTKVGEHASGANSISWRRDGAEFATAGQDGMVKVWSGESGELLQALPVGSPWVSKVSYSPKTNELAATAGKILVVWDESKKLSYESNDHASTIADLGWNPDGSGIAVAAYYGVSVHVPQKKKAPRKYEWKGSSLALAWSPDATYIATGEQDSTVHFWHRKSGEDSQMSGYPSKVQELSWDKTGRWLATGGSEAVCLWDCSSPGPAGRQPLLYPGHSAKLTQVAFQPDGELLASTDAESVLLLWDPMNKKDALDGGKLSSPASCLRWVSGGKLAVGLRDGDIAVFTTEASISRD